MHIHTHTVNLQLPMHPYPRAAVRVVRPERDRGSLCASVALMVGSLVRCPRPKFTPRHRCGNNEGHACVCTGINCANQTDELVLRGDAAGEAYTPTFTYHGFRYVQIEGWPDAAPPPDASSLTALFVHSAVKKTGSVVFNESLAILNGIQTAYIFTQLSNMHSHPTDCPTREKRGWTGDSQLTSGGAALNFDALAFYGASKFGARGRGGGAQHAIVPLTVVLLSMHGDAPFVWAALVQRTCRTRTRSSEPDILVC